MKVRVVVCIFLFSYSSQYAVVKGSETAVSIEAAATFPAADVDNTAAAFAWFRNGFSLEDAVTTCTFQSVFPVSGAINLNGGMLYLGNDLVLSNGVLFVGNGSVDMGVHNIDFGKTNAVWSGDIAWTMNESSLNMYSRIDLNGVWTCNGVGEIKGHGHNIVLGNEGAIVVGPNSTLRLQDLRLESISGTNIRCMADDSVIILDNVQWGHQNDLTYTFTMGALHCYNKVKMVGTSSFVYQTIQTSTVHVDASLQFDSGFTFSYDPQDGGKNLLEFDDSSAELILNNAMLHATSTGLQFTKGALVVKGDSFFSSEIWKTEGDDQRVTIVDEGITFGDGVSSSNDLKCIIRLGAQLKLTQGSLIYKNLLTSSWVMENQLSSLILYPATRLCIQQSLPLGVGQMVMHEKALREIAVGKEIVGSVFIVD